MSMDAKQLRHRDILDKLSTEEKCSLLSGEDFWSTPVIERAGVPAIRMSDGPHGLRLQDGDSDNLGINKSVPATCFPTACALACSWDEELLHKVGDAIAREAAHKGVGILLGPGLCLKRDPLCGRNFEYFSEDPLLAGKLAAAMIRGIQNRGISACPKHFAVNNQETRRLAVDAVVDRRTLRELYLPAFETAVREGRPRALMSAYNKLNGVFCSENPWLLTQVLRREWGYEGFVMTDWGAGNDRRVQLLAGGDLEMPGTRGETDREVLEAIRAGQLDREALDESLDRLLDAALAADKGVRAAPAADMEAHHALARSAAAQSAVLLKNLGQVLPLPKGAKVAVIGDFAKTPRYQGSGSSIVNPTRLDDYRELEKAGLEIVGYEKGFKRYGGNSPALTRRACALAKKADYVLLYMGLDEYSELEGDDRRNMRLPENQTALLEALAAVNGDIIVILSCGAPVETGFAHRARALLHCMLGGQAVAGAVADILTGRVNPSGKLAESYPIRYEDSPASAYFPGGPVTTEYREGLYVGYRYYLSAGVPVSYPFGYGLSYTRFELSGLDWADGAVSLTVRNTGSRDGAEVAQIYVQPLTPGPYRPLRTLAAFKKVYLKAGEAKRVTMPLPERAFQYWEEETESWTTQAGDYMLLAGNYCTDERLSLILSLPGSPPRPCPSALEPYMSARVKRLPDAAFQALLGRPIPAAEADPAAPLDMNVTVETGGKRPGLPRFILRSLGLAENACRALGARQSAVTLSIARYMPYRSLWRVTNGVFDREMLEGLMQMLNGSFFAGLSTLGRGMINKRNIRKPMYDPRPR